MALRLFAFLLSAFVASACGTKVNTDVCCIGAADCAQLGLEEERPCADGLTCVNNDCVATSCETEGCPVDQPVCNVVSGMCEGCADATDCMSDVATPVCDVESGVCVGCVTNADCSGTTPICDDTLCRGCTDDVDCDSGACGDDGSCVAEADIAYVAPDGEDLPPCSREQPCYRVQYANMTLGGTRRHIVMAPGEYDNSHTMRSSPTLPSLVLHGGGATISDAAGDGLFIAAVPIEVRHLTLVNTSGITAIFSFPSLLRDVRIVGWMANNGTLTIEDSRVEASTRVGIVNRGTLIMNRSELVGGVSAISCEAGSNLMLENVIVRGTSDVALDIGPATGTISFSTIAMTGALSTTVRGARCSTMTGFRIQNSILWTPQDPANPVGDLVTVENCAVTESIAGPAAVAGNFDADPLFVNPAAGDFHISTVSPAKDRVMSGPARDFEGQARPAGAGFDLGADELQ